MRYLIIIAIFFQFNYTYAQMVGDTRSTILELESSDPCVTRSNKLLFCLQGHNRVVYSFNSKGYCGSISKMTFVSREEAEDILANKLSSHDTKPYVSGNKYTFFWGDSCSIFYSIEFDIEYGVFFWVCEQNSDLLEG